MIGRSDGLLQQFDGPKVVDAAHLPVSESAGCADSGHRCDQRVGVEFVYAHELRSANRCREVAEHAAMVGKAAPATAIDRTTLDREFDIFRQQFSSHRFTSSLDDQPR